MSRSQHHAQLHACRYPFQRADTAEVGGLLEHRRVRQAVGTHDAIGYFAFEGRIGGSQCKLIVDLRKFIRLTVPFSGSLLPFLLPRFPVDDVPSTSFDLASCFSHNEGSQITIYHSSVIALSQEALEVLKHFFLREHRK